MYAVTVIALGDMRKAACKRITYYACVTLCIAKIVSYHALSLQELDTLELT